MAGTPDQKARGAFFTPPAIAQYLADWAIRSESDHVLEPSCGEAVFLSAAARRLSQVGSEGGACRLHGVELHEASAATARTILEDAGEAADIHVGDFFEHEPERVFDVILGNPPFVRYQDFSGPARARSLEAALAQGVRLSGLSSSWAAFVVKAAQHLTAQGRLALVLPAELLSVSYAAEVRRFLLRRFASLKLVAFEERLFPGVLEDVVLLLAEGTGGASCFELHQTRNAETLLTDAAAWTAYSPDDGAKWTPALVASDAFAIYRQLQDANCEDLAAWGRTYLGAVTGNNRFFSLKEADVVEHGIPCSDLVRISPPGARHLRGLVFSDASWRAATKQGGATYLFRPSDEYLSDASRAYVAQGEAAGVSKGYKARMRAPWWRVPLVDVPDLFLTYMNHDRPRLVANEAKAQILNSIYGVKLQDDRRDVGMSLLPLACLNSVTLLGAEMVGRAYGGGLLKLEPREADTLPVPSLAAIEANLTKLEAVAPQLGTCLRQNDIDAATRLIDPILFPQADASDLEGLRAAREVQFQRRRTRAGRGAN
nr:N-6 DNA methylase [Jannaschia sp. Os4]